MSLEVGSFQTIVTGSVEIAARLLRQGELVIFPTETVYGLGANALDPVAVAKIYAAKQRPADNPLIVHIHSLDQVEQLARKVPEYAWNLMQAFFPGPLTLLFNKTPVIPDPTTAGSPKVCLRMPSLPLAQQLLRECALPIAAPSANLSGRPSPTRWQDCLEDMLGRVAAILQGPEAIFGLESTIVDCSGLSPVLMRPGSITFEELKRLAPKIALYSSNLPIALPGMKYRHYAPKAQVQLIGAGEKPAIPGESAGFIGLNTPAFAAGYSLVAGSPQEYARQLFAFFRECDRLGLKVIYAEKVEETGLGRAIMNRLQKAASES